MIEHDIRRFLHRHVAAFIILLATASVSTQAAEPDDTLVVPAPAAGVDIGDTLVDDLVSFYTDGLILFSSPARFTSGDWAVAGGVLAATGLVTTLDRPIRRNVLDLRNVTADQIAETGNVYGTWLAGGGAGGGLYVAGLIFDEPGVRRAGRHVLQAILYSGMITTATKFLVGRRRPSSIGPYNFSGPTSNDEHHSLPSGHSTMAFAISSTLAAEIDHPAATVLLYGAATVTALCRVYVDRHWTSDVLLGAAIGTACGYGTVHLYDEPTEDGMSFQLIPMPTGLAAVWVF